MRINRQINKQNKITKIAKIQEKQMARYTKIREEIKDKTKEELNLLLLSKNLSKTDRYAIIHTIKKLDNPITDSITDVNSEHIIHDTPIKGNFVGFNQKVNDSTNTNNTLSREDINIKEEKS